MSLHERIADVIQQTPMEDLGGGILEFPVFMGCTS